MTSPRPGTLQADVWDWLAVHSGWHATPDVAQGLHEPRPDVTRAADALYAKRLVDRREGAAVWGRRVMEWCYIEPPDDEPEPQRMRRTCPLCHMRTRNITRHYEYEHPGEKYRP